MMMMLRRIASISRDRHSAGFLTTTCGPFVELGSSNSSVGNTARSLRSLCSSASHAVTSREDDFEPLVEIEEAVLAYPNASEGMTVPYFAISPPTFGGHAVLGRNATGKSVLSNTLAQNGDSTYLRAGSFYTDKVWHSGAVAHVSFESHEALLAEGGTVSRAISGGRGNLSKAAQFLIVRFGLFPLLHRDVSTLSTGEIRKVLLVRALADRPRLLVLDNAFDGLDVDSRENLKDLVSKTIAGFRPDILVQAVSASATAHTQVVLMTHRAEEIVDEIETISWWNDEGNLQTVPREGQPGEQVLESALRIEDGALFREPWDDPSLPSVEEVAASWNKGTRRDDKSSSDILVQASELTVRRGDATLLDVQDWTVRRGERWLVAGGNGAGKSTLSRFLAKRDRDIAEGSLSVATDGVSGWVSTELHMAVARSTQTVGQVLADSTNDTDFIEAVTSWLELNDPALLSRPFSALSQGQQKLVLIAAAFASRPELLVLDEPCQGLDLVNRHRVLGLCERICQATDMSLIYITHHLEELLPSVTSVLHLVKGGRPAYSGIRNEYDPENL